MIINKIKYCKKCIEVLIFIFLLRILDYYDNRKPKKPSGGLTEFGNVPGLQPGGCPLDTQVQILYPPQINRKEFYGYFSCYKYL